MNGHPSGFVDSFKNALGLSRRGGNSAFTLQIQGAAARLNCTEGQVYSMAIGLVAATVLAVTGSVPLGKAVEAAAAGQPPGTVLADPGVPPVNSFTDAPVEPELGEVPELSGPGDLGSTPLGEGGGVDVPNVEPPTSPQPTEQPPAAEVKLTSQFKVGSPGFPAALATDADNLYVGSDNSSSAQSTVGVYERTGGLARTITVKGQPDTKDGGLSAAALVGETLYVTDRSRAALVKIEGTAQTVLVRLPDIPACILGVADTCQPGLEDRAPSPQGLVVIGGFAYISDAAQGIIWRYEFATEELVSWYSNADMTTGSGPTGLATDGSNLVFSASSTIDVGALLQGAVYRLAIGPDGAAGARTLAAAFPEGADPGPVAIGSSGDIYVALLGAGGISTISSDGTVADLAGTDQFPAPRGVSLADGVLYVADAGSSPSKSSGTVKAVIVADGPAR